MTGYTPITSLGCDASGQSGALRIEKDPLPEDRRFIGRLPLEQYYSTLALSNSGMKDLAVSPLRYWYRWINLERVPEEPSPEMKFGTALHCLVLEGERKFNGRYARMLDEQDYPECLVTIEDCRAWLRDKGHKPSGTRKADVIEQVRAIDATVPIWDAIQAEHEAANHDKMLCLREDWDRIWGAAEALRAEPKLQEILRNGEAETSLLNKDPETGTPLKARLDWLTSDCILDLKTFTQRRGKSIDQSVADAIYYEGYYKQAFFYATLHQRVTGRTKALKFILAFVESDPPHEVRIRELRQSCQGVMNIYWQKAQIETRHFCRIWADCMEKFGRNPWREPQRIEELLDEEMKGMVFS